MMASSPVIGCTGWAIPAEWFPVAKPCTNAAPFVFDCNAPLAEGVNSSPPAASDFAQVLYHMIVAQNSGPVTLIGWSTGALIALEVASLWPEQVERLVLVSATACFVQREGYPHGVESGRLQWMRKRLVGRHAEKVLRDFYAQTAAPSVWESERVERLLAPLREPAYCERLQHGLDYLHHTDLRARCADIRVPVHLVHGAQDRIIPMAAAEWLADHLPCATLNRLPDAGHGIPFDHPHAMASPVRSPSVATSTPAYVRRFSAAAPTYDRHANVQRKAEDRLRQVILDAESSTPLRILEIGCGTGRLTRQLADAFPAAQVDALDASPGMLHVARSHRADDGARIRWICNDFLHFSATAPYDLIVSASTFQWFHSLAEALERVHRFLGPSGLFACACMLNGTLAELRACRAEVAPPTAPPRPLPDHAAVLTALHEVGLHVRQQFENEYLEHFAGARVLLHALHEQGVTGGSLSRHGPPLTRGQLTQLIQRYETLHSLPDGKVYARYQVGTYLASK